MRSDVLSLAVPRIRRLKYMLLSGSRAEENVVGYHNSAYQLWRRCWLKTFDQLHTEAVLRADDFVRQSIISALFHEDKAIGLLLHSYFSLNLDAARDHTYLASYPAPVIASLRESGAREVLSMEYLTLDPEWRKSMTGGIPLAEIILGLGAKVAQESGIKSMIVVTRNDRGVNEILYGYGARCLVANQQKHNVAVDLVSLDQGSTTLGSNEDTSKWIQYFWNRREDPGSVFPRIPLLTARVA